MYYVTHWAPLQLPCQDFVVIVVVLVLFLFIFACFLFVFCFSLKFYFILFEGKVGRA